LHAKKNGHAASPSITREIRTHAQIYIFLTGNQRCPSREEWRQLDVLVVDFYI
jgi:hypothetical protein